MHNDAYRQSSQVSFVVDSSQVGLIDSENTPADNNKDTNTMNMPHSVDDDYNLRMMGNSKPSWWSKRTCLERFLLVISLLALLVILCMSIVTVCRDAKGYLVHLKHVDGAISGPYNAKPYSGSHGISESLKNNKKPIQVCTTRSCVEAASALLGSIDQNIDPCDDFYEFSCGEWNRRHSIPEDAITYGAFQEVRDQVQLQLRKIYEEPDTEEDVPVFRSIRGMFRQCVDKKQLNRAKGKEIVEKMEQTGPWPMLELKEWTMLKPDLKNKTQFSNFLAKVHNELKMKPLFPSYVYADPEDTTRYIMNIRQPSLVLKLREYYLNATKYEKEMNAYRTYMTTVLKVFISDYAEYKDEDGDRFMNQVNLTQKVNQIIEFETRFAEILMEEAKRRSQATMFNRLTLANMTDDVIPVLDWSLFLSETFPDEVQELITPDYVINVQDIDYFLNVSNFIWETDAEIWYNYVMWLTVNQYGEMADSRYTDALQTLMETVFGREQEPAKWKVCGEILGRQFSIAVGAMYIKKHFNEEDKKEADEMITRVQDAFKQIVTDLDWMDTKTKNFATDKAENMQLNVGHQTYARNPLLVQKEYEGLKLNKSESYLLQSLAFSKWSESKDLAKLNDTFDRTRMQAGAAEVNAYYSPEENAITFPAGILQPPFFKGDTLKSLNYGGIGTVIGHEVTHGFDDQGRHHDKVGMLFDWWSPTAATHFNHKKNCMIRQYGSYKLEEINMHVNGELTVGENIADNGGLKESYRAYQNYVEINGEEDRLPGLSNITNDQLFFISFAHFWCGLAKKASLIEQVRTDPHSPSRYRVIGVMSNSEDFAKAFKCKAGSNMNPYGKCTVW